ncbi:MAG: hypothetical protein IPO87_00875 [Flavobacteriales bacterium]|nr:hypothetical protein [Flavobacteriales bacterium]
MFSRNNLFRTLFLVLLFGVNSGAFAQKGKTKVVLYKDRLAAQFDTVKCVKNVIKLNPLIFFRGEIPIYYERSITPRLGIEVGVGVTLRNYLALSFTGDDADDFGQGTKIVPQPSFHIGLRYYLNDDLEPQGPYLQPTFSHLRFTKEIQEKDSLGAFTSGKFNTDDRVYNDIRCYFGYQMLSNNSNMLFDLYCGLAYRDRFNTKVNEDIVFQDGINGGPQRRTYVYTIEENKSPTVAFFIGIKVGMGF